VREIRDVLYASFQDPATGQPMLTMAGVGGNTVRRRCGVDTRMWTLDGDEGEIFTEGMRGDRPCRYGAS
jgi:hypothetical protein